MGRGERKEGMEMEMTWLYSGDYKKRERGGIEGDEKRRKQGQIIKGLWVGMQRRLNIIQKLRSTIVFSTL